jgi:spore germination cell wall hydrolase CwlJ-like protein
MRFIIAVIMLSVISQPSLGAIIVPNTSYSEEEVTWLVKNVYFEARNQGIAGQLAVAMTTINRVEDRRFPDTIKEVVTQAYTYKNGFPIRHKCQFSWYCDGKSDKIRDWETYNNIRNIVVTYLQNRDIIFDITEGAVFYHADYVSPSWAKVKEKTIEIEDHIFYRWN